MPGRARQLLLVSPLVLLAGCGLDAGVPDPATEEGGMVLGQYRVLLVLAIVIGAIVLGAMAWSLVRFRRHPDDHEPPEQRHGHVGIEVVGVAVPLLIVAGLFVFILRVHSETTESVDDPDVIVEVTGYRWGWRFHYPEEDVTIEAGPGEEPEIVLPVDATIRLRVQTDDVIHSFFVPEFLTKRDLIPGEPSEVDLELTRSGTFDGHCAEFCGLDHARMNFVVVVDDAEVFRRWLDDRRGAEV